MVDKSNDEEQQKECLKKLIKKYQSHFMKMETLTGREQTCLFLAAVGKSIKETANILDLECSTVKSYRSAAIQKLNCKNIAHAVFVTIIYKTINYCQIYVDITIEIDNE